MELKVCPNCGKRVLSIAKVCKHCSYSFTGDNLVTPPTLTQEGELPPPPPIETPTYVEPPRKDYQYHTPPPPQNKKPKMFSNVFGFTGRIRRSEYFITMLISFLVSYIPFVGLISIWVCLAAAIKRCHDINLSGWFCLIPFFGIALLFVDTKEGDNKYGPNPKY